MSNLRLLLASHIFPGGQGVAADVGYTMSDREVSFWRDQAALLDPAAYEFVTGTSQSETVPDGENWYLQEGWNLKTTGGGGEWFHRGGDVRDALPLPEGTVLETPSSAGGTPHWYVCKPSLVIDDDARYSSDPRALYFERLMRLFSEIPHYRIGDTQVTAGVSSDADFPGDFTNGIIVHVSTQDLSWIIPGPTDKSSGLITQMEISDEDPVRIAAVALIPFDRTLFPRLQFNGAGLAAGRGSVTYAKLDGIDW